MTSIDLKRVTCLRCRYSWTPRVAEVRECANPKCRSPRWDLPRPRERKRRGGRRKQAARRDSSTLPTLRTTPSRRRRLEVASGENRGGNQKEDAREEGQRPTSETSPAPMREV
jgi:hypothetical protein